MAGGSLPCGRADSACARAGQQPPRLASAQLSAALPSTLVALATVGAQPRPLRSRRLHTLPGSPPHTTPGTPSGRKLGAQRTHLICFLSPRDHRPSFMKQSCGNLFFFFFTYFIWIYRRGMQSWSMLFGKKEVKKTCRASEKARR